MSNTPDSYSLDTAFGAGADERAWRQMAARERTRSADLRHRASCELNALLGAMFPASAARPCTYGMPDEVRRKHAAALMASQEIPWADWEIQRRLVAPSQSVGVR